MSVGSLIDGSPVHLERSQHWHSASRRRGPAEASREAATTGPTAPVWNLEVVLPLDARPHVFDLPDRGAGR